MTTEKLADAVETSLGALKLRPEDEAAAALLRLWACEIDGAAAWRARADRVARETAEQVGRESALYEEVQALRAKLSERTALAVLGKLVAAHLSDLLATPKARPQGKAGSGQGAARVTPLTKLRSVQ